MKQSIVSVRPQGRGWVATAAAGMMALCLGQTCMAQAVTCRVEPLKSVMAADTSETMMVRVSLKGGEVPLTQRAPINLCLVIDRSGSMRGDRIAHAKEAAIAAVERLTPKDIVSVVIFDQEVETIVPAQFAQDKAFIANAIRQVYSRGSTAIFGAMAQAAAEIRKNAHREYLNRIILLSDGRANIGPSQSDDFGRLGVSLAKEGISTSTVGVGLDFNEDLMTSLAGRSDGNSYFVENSDDLSRIFSSELGTALNVAARNISLRIAFASGTTPLEIVGREGSINGGTVTLDFNQLYGGQEKYVLIRTAFSPGQDKTSRQVATANVKYVDAATSRLEQLSATGSIRFSRDSDLARRSVNTDVLRDAELNENAIAVEKAIRLVDEGKTKEAADVFSAQAERLERISEVYDMPELRKSAARQLSNADGASRGNFDARARKENVQAEYEVMNQQTR